MTTDADGSRGRVSAEQRLGLQEVESREKAEGMSSSAPSLWLSDAEVADATRRKYPAAQARVLDDWRVPYQRRPDGTLQVGRAAMEAAMAGGTMAGKPAANGLNWSARA